MEPSILQLSKNMLNMFKNCKCVNFYIIGDQNGSTWFYFTTGIPSDCLLYILLVEVNGFEPMTSCVQGRRSPN